MIKNVGVAVQTQWLVKSQELDGFIGCLECNKHIINPICPECVNKEFEQFLESYPKLKHLKKQSEKYLEKHKSFCNNFETCIKCNKNSVYMCMPCFSKVLFQLVKESGNKKAIEEFKEIFNYGRGYEYE